MDDWRLGRRLLPEEDVLDDPDDDDESDPTLPGDLWFAAPALYEARRGAESVVVYSLTAARRMIEARGGMCDR